ncbi:hypothetical protein FPOA_11113 [Fusarium poae]|uniref:peptidylprolyl isomerase n=2 Tax=Fusarium poae TaxID=36050 RepID=A0A1B8AFX6_FUSPO|nr:hypothetical protein FPOA_11113 [Fusarium poae]
MDADIFARSGGIGGGDSSDRPGFYKPVGIGLAVGSGVFIGVSFVLKKFGLLRANEKYNEVAGEGYGYLKNFWWWTGMILMIIGEILNFVAYAFTDAILVTPLGALSVVIAAILSSIFLKERLSLVGKVGCFLCIVGSVVIVMNAPHSSSVSDIQQMQGYFITPGFLTYAGIIIVGSAVTAIWVAPKYGNKNMLVYISICSWVGGLSVASTQGLGAAIIAWIGGKPQYKEWFLWVLFVFVICTLLTEIIYLNKALNIYNAALVTPTYYVYFTSTTIITSAILYQGFKGSVQSIVTVVLGFLTICSGVVLLQISKSAKDVPDSAVFNGDLDQIQTIVEQEQPETDPKADAIRGTAAIVRQMSQRRLRMEAEELKRLHEEKMMMEAMDPIREDGQQPEWEWDGLRRRRTMTFRTGTISSSRAGSVTSPPPQVPPISPRFAVRPSSPRQHPPLGMSQFPPIDDDDDDDNDNDDGNNRQETNTLFSSIAGTIRGRARGFTNFSGRHANDDHEDDKPRPRSPMHPVPLTEIAVPRDKADEEHAAYYGQTREHAFNGQDTEYRGASFRSGNSLAPPTPPPHGQPPDITRHQRRMSRTQRRKSRPDSSKTIADPDQPTTRDQSDGVSERLSVGNLRDEINEVESLINYLPTYLRHGTAHLTAADRIYAHAHAQPTMSRSLQLKDEGNKCFMAGDYVGAEALYSKAIIADARNPALYTNRAMARLKLNYWDSVVTDCEACLQLTPDNMKARYYLAEAQLALRDYDASLASALHAHKLCAATNDRSLAAVTSLVLRCKKERWDDREKKRMREAKDLEREVLEMLNREKEATLAETEDGMEKQEIEEETNAKIERMKDIFERARADADKKREVPDWAIDDISFGFMIDPVMTKTGKSYERSSIMEHLRRHPSDPLTREPLTTSELRPNLALKQACEEFLESNGWAADW